MNRLKKKKFYITGGLCLVMAGAIAATVAYSHDWTNFGNDFQLDQYQTEFTETFDAPTNWKTCDTTPKEFVVKNTYSEPISVRIKTTSSWKSSTGGFLPNYSSGSGVNMALINYANNNEWLNKNYDGVAYKEYYRALQPGETTSTFISSVTFNCDADLNVDTRYNDATYKLSITAQTVASSEKSKEWRTTATLYQSLKGSFANYVNPGDITDGDICTERNSSGYYTAYSCVKNIVHADALPGNGVSTQQIGNGDYKIFGWLSSDYRTLYWYTEADDTYLPSDCASMFNNMGKLESTIGLRDVKASKTTDMQYMFYYDTSLTDLSGLESWDVSRVENMSYMFFYTNLDTFEPLRNWNVSSLKNMNKIFIQNVSNSKIGTAEPLSGWNVSSVTTMEGAFMNIRDFDASSLSDWPLDSSAYFDRSTFGCNVVFPSWYTYTPYQCSN